MCLSDKIKAGAQLEPADTTEIAGIHVAAMGPVGAARQSHKAASSETIPTRDVSPGKLGLVHK